MPFLHAKPLGWASFRARIFLSSAVLKKGRSVIARVEKESAFKRRFEISSAGYPLPPWPSGSTSS